MSEIELKPCPFCGSDDIKDDVYMRDGREVVCRECKARVGEFNPNANDKAVEKWNRRASEVSNEWVKWDGGNFMPVPGEAVVTVMLRDGSIEGPARAREFAGDDSCWKHRGSDGDIVAYRLSASPSPVDSRELSADLMAALSKCRTSFCGYSLKGDYEQAAEVVAAFYKELMRIDGVARAALLAAKEQQP